MNNLARIEPQNSMSMALDDPSVFAALPQHITKQKFQQVAMVAANMNEDLKECIPQSIVNALINCAKDGLVPDGREAVIITYNKRQGTEWVKIAQYQPMIDGVLKRLRMSGEVLNITAKVVYEGDTFECWTDIEGEHFKYAPTLDSSKRGEIKLAFSVAKLKNGECVFEHMLRSDIDEIMYRSKSAVDKDGELRKGSIWQLYFPRMSLKSVLHRISKRLPNSSEVLEMLERDIDLIKSSTTTPKAALPQVQNDWFITPKQLDELEKLIEEKGTTKEKVLAWVGAKTDSVVKDYDGLSEDQFLMLYAVLNK